jgi:hypothetical protein
MYGDNYRRVVCGAVVNCNVCGDVDCCGVMWSLCGDMDRCVEILSVVQECCGGGLAGCGVETLRCEVEAWDYLTKCITHVRYLVYLVAVTTL